MTRINLLPWRETRRREREKQFYFALGVGASLTVGIVFYINSHINYLLENQIQRNNYLQRQITLVEKEISEIKDLERQKENLLARMGVIQQLQASRPQIVYLFDEMARILPEGVHLESLRRQRQTSVINGIAESNARISVFMRNLDTSPVFQDPRLDIIERSGKERGGGRNFTLHVDEIPLSGKSEEEMGIW
jgi:type IV pilus assembly protein PilN